VKNFAVQSIYDLYLPDMEFEIRYSNLSLDERLKRMSGSLFEKY
jgi:hypothetical protein